MGHGEDNITEVILAECLEAFDEGGESAVRRIVERHPERRDVLERRLKLLGSIGLGPSPPTNRPLSIGGGRFRVERELGRGGMGVVWLVHDSELGRQVALKTGPSFAAGDRARERFEREVRAATRLDHPHVVPILDVGRDGEMPWYTMEYVEGATLAQALTWARQLGLAPGMLEAAHLHDCTLPAEKRTPAEGWNRTWIETVCRILIDVARGLEHVHAHGIVHRDVKPSNILVDSRAHGRLFDLGLAHLGDEPGLTRTGDLAGTPHYVAPEQVSGQRGVDARTDVYALGVTLYEALTLRRPFEGRSTAEVLARIQSSDPPPLRRHHPELPRELETICQTALEKDPDQRYARAADMAADLERFLSFRPIQAQPVSWRRRTLRFVRRRPAHAALISLAMLVAIGTPIGLIQANTAIRRQRDRAEAKAIEAQYEAETTRAVLAFLTDLFVVAAGEDEGAPPVSASELLQLGATRAAAHYVDRPLLQASLFEAIGRTYENLGRPREAIPLLDRSLALRERELGQMHLQVARVLHALAGAHLSDGNHDAAHALGERALRSIPATSDESAAAQADTWVTLGDIALARQDLLAARVAFETALAQRQALGADTLATADVLTRLGDVLVEQGELDQAERVLEEGHAIRRGLTARVDLPVLASSLESLARLYDRRGRPGDAREALKEALGLYRKAYGSSDPAVQQVLARLTQLTPNLAGTGTGWADRERSKAAIGNVEAHLDPALGFQEPRPTEYFEASQVGITALQASRYDKAVRAFEHCLELVPTASTAAYNLACSLSRSGRSSDALDALERATLLGQDDTRDRAELLSKDPDLEAIRNHPRFEATAERWRVSARALRSYQSQAATYVPARLHEREDWPLVIVVHAAGSTKEQIVQGPWRSLADELGFALLAPSGRVSLAEDPRDGATWIRSLDSFEKRAWEYEEPINRALEEFRRDHPVDQDALIIVGEGVGALIAFDVALQSPGVFRGVLLQQGTVHATLSLERVGHLAALGTRVLLRVDPQLPIAGLPSDTSAAALAAAWEGVLSAHGIEGDARLTESGSGALRASLKSLLSQ